MILYIDTTGFDRVTFGLAGEKLFKKTYKIHPHKSHETLGLLDRFLKAAKIKNTAIKKIVVNKGPGSFTGIRVGLAHALALGLALNIPVKAFSKEKFIPLV